MIGVLSTKTSLDNNLSYFYSMLKNVPQTILCKHQEWRSQYKLLVQCIIYDIIYDTVAKRNCKEK